MVRSGGQEQPPAAAGSQQHLSAEHYLSAQQYLALAVPESSAVPESRRSAWTHRPAGPPRHTPAEAAPGRGSGHQHRRLAPVAVALDAPDIDVAAHWATLVTPYVSTVKIGLELYLRYGPAVVATVRGGSGVQVFLDLKLHDIPNTVAGAARAVAKLRPEILTVHAAGGAEMIKAAVAAVPDTVVAAVTLLTSIGDKDLAQLGIGGPVSDAVRRMAVLAVAAGARGLVCSPQEVAAVRAEVGPGHHAHHPGDPPGRRHQRRPGADRHPRGGAQGRARTCW